jgi:amino acid transporter
LSRIFAVLAVLAIVLLVANFVVGLMGGDFNAAAQRKREAQSRLLDAERQSRAGQGGQAAVEEAREAAVQANEKFTRPRSMMTLHMLLGTTAALATLLVNSITITYFIGTSRWCKEVCETYQLSAELAEESTVLKRRTFPWALAGIFTVILLIGLGAAADPSGANWGRSAQFVMPHYLAAMIGIVVVIASFWVQIGRIAENYGVIERIMAEVERVRAERGLEVTLISNGS